MPHATCWVLVFLLSQMITERLFDVVKYTNSYGAWLLVMHCVMFIVPDTYSTCVCFKMHMQYAFGGRRVVRWWWNVHVKYIKLHVGMYQYTCASVYVCAPPIREPTQCVAST